MSDRFLQIDVDADALIEALEKAPIEIMRHWSQAGREAGAEVLGTTGVKEYPAEPTTRKPTASYQRGIGYVYADGHTNGSSERYGTQFNVRQRGRTQTIIGNRASYAEFLGGEDQSTVINKNIIGQGWQRLVDVVDNKLTIILEIYTLWMKKALRKIGLL